MNTKEILHKILEKPFEFYEIVRNKDLESAFGGSEINENQEQLFHLLKKSPFGEYLGSLDEVVVYNVVNMVLEEINKKKKWIQNSKIRENCFYYLGKLESTTTTEIGKVISKHPKSVSTYLAEFKKENWVDDPVKEGREMIYSLSDIGLSFFKLASRNYWFQNIISEKISLEQTLIKIEAYELLSEDVLGSKKLNNYRNIEKREPDYIDDSNGTHYFFELTWNDFELNHRFIEEMTPIIETFAEKFEGTRSLPKIIPLEDYLIAVNTTDELKLALIFAVFNYSKKNRFINKFYWDYGAIKVINIADYFEDSITDITNSEGFMSEEQSKKFVKKVLANYRSKIEDEKV